jgi:hypothetical protein
VAVLLLASGNALAQQVPDAAASVWLGLSLDHTDEPRPPVAPPDVAAFDLRLRFLLGNTVGYLPGLDLRLGGGLDGGFAYGFDLLAAGFAVRVGDDGWVALAAGGGLSGVIGRLPFAWRLPVELAAELDLDEHVRLIGCLRVAWDAGGRPGGAPALPFADEAEVLLGLRLGDRKEYGDLTAASGYVIALRYGELMGSHVVGVAVAFAMSAGSRR